VRDARGWVEEIRLISIASWVNVCLAGAVSKLLERESSFSREGGPPFQFWNISTSGFGRVTAPLRIQRTNLRTHHSFRKVAVVRISSEPILKEGSRY
jgi:hypothetical protein